MNRSKNVQKFYDLCHKEYDLHMSKSGHYAAQEKILLLLEKEIQEPILDLACGNGFLMSQLSKNFSLVFGNDFSHAMAKEAAKKTGFLITKENAEKLASYKQKFGTIICCNLFFYLQNRVKAINRWANLLEMNGKIIFIEEYPFIKPNSKDMHKYAPELMEIIQPFSVKDIQNLMAQNGFCLVSKVKVQIDDKHDLYGLVFSFR